MRHQYTTATYDRDEHCWIVIDERTNEVYCFDSRQAAEKWARVLNARAA